MVPANRRRNPRGAGWQLRAEIVDAARGLLVETGDDTAVTLRAVARRIGISAPSIYAHFDDVDQIVRAVVDETSDELIQRLEHAGDGVGEPGERLVALCRAYVQFGIDRPELYALLFARPRPAASLPTDGPAYGRAFELLMRTVDDVLAPGSSTDDRFVTATELWVALHGLVSLRRTMLRFPWPEQRRLETDLIRRIAGIRAP